MTDIQITSETLINCPENTTIKVDKISGFDDTNCNMSDIKTAFLNQCDNKKSCTVTAVDMNCESGFNLKYSCVGNQDVNIQGEISHQNSSAHQEAKDSTLNNINENKLMINNELNNIGKENENNINDNKKNENKSNNKEKNDTSNRTVTTFIIISVLLIIFIGIGIFLYSPRYNKSVSTQYGGTSTYSSGTSSSVSDYTNLSGYLSDISSLNSFVSPIMSVTSNGQIPNTIQSNFTASQNFQ